MLLLSKNPLFHSELPSPACCWALWHGGEGSWKAAHPTAVPRKAGLSRLVGGPVTLVPLAAELMEALKLREPARVSLQLPLEGALGLFLAITER